MLCGGNNQAANKSPELLTKAKTKTNHFRKKIEKKVRYIENA